MTRILLVEDDSSLGATLAERLTKQAYEVKWAQSLRDAKNLLEDFGPDLIVLDVGLPDGSGFDFAHDVNRSTKTPIIFLTAQSNAESRLRGFEAGAEEFIPKPFHLKELFLRIQHVAANHIPPTQVGTFKLDRGARSIIDDQGRREVLAQKDFELLTLLVDESPRVVSRDEILDRVWGPEQFPSNRTVDNIIVRIRASLGGYGNWVKSVRGVGYQWLPESQRE
ncbi:MAG: response regulator transcription factor [Oligoflexia bacterium]|nr:response regulator transcription factor [Oligoflexia bacterium]